MKTCSAGGGERGLLIKNRDHAILIHEGEIAITLEGGREVPAFSKGRGQRIDVSEERKSWHRSHPVQGHPPPISGQEEGSWSSRTPIGCWERKPFQGKQKTNVASGQTGLDLKKVLQERRTAAGCSGETETMGVHRESGPRY